MNTLRQIKGQHFNYRLDCDLELQELYIISSRLNADLECMTLEYSKENLKVCYDAMHELLTSTPICVE